MKKILLATTVLVGTAGFASAEVTLSGNGRMGITYAESNVPGAKETSFNSRVRASVNMSASTDGGLEFGGSFGIHDAATRLVPDGDDADLLPDTAGGANDGLEGTVFISGAFGKLSMGSTDNAAKNAVGEIDGVGYTGLGDHNEVGYYNSDKEMALYSYSVSGFTGFLSVGQPDNAEDNYALGASYKTDTFSVGIGYEDVDAAGTASDKTAVTVSASGTFSGVTAKAIYATEDVAVGADWESYGVSAKYTLDAVSVTGFYRQAERAGNTDYFQGIGASYSLGGGATLAGGVVNNNGQTKADLGVNFSF